MTHRKTRSSLVMLLLGLLWSTSASAGPERWPGARWKQVSGPSRGWSAAKLREAKKLFTRLRITAAVVVDGGLVVARWGDAGRPVNCHSVRKSLVSALYGIYVGRKKIDVRRTLAQLGIDDKLGLSPAEKRARVLDLLMARSGVYHPAAYETKSMKRKRPARGAHAPGTFFYYNNWDFNALGTIFEQLAGGDIYKIFARELARPLQMQHFTLAHGKRVRSRVSRHVAHTFWLSADDRARVGLLYLRGGRWRDKRLLAKSWIARSTKPLSRAGRGVGFGYLWWASTGRWHLRTRVVPPVYSARGNWGQYIIVLPFIDTVVVFANDKKGGAPRLRGRDAGKLLRAILQASTAYRRAIMRRRR